MGRVDRGVCARGCGLVEEGAVTLSFCFVFFSGCFATENPTPRDMKNEK